MFGCLFFEIIKKKKEDKEEENKKPNHDIYQWWILPKELWLVDIFLTYIIRFWI